MIGVRAIQTVEERTRRWHARQARIRASAKVLVAVKRGRLERGPCARCAFTGKTDGHHFDYSRPLDVIWLCRACHAREHVALRHPTPRP